MMSVEVFMPKLGMTMKEGLITNWLKKEGDAVAKDEPVLEIETEKISAAVEAPASGILEKIYFPKGETVPIGAVLALIGEKAGETAPSGEKADGAPAFEAPGPEKDGKIIKEVIPLGGIRKVIGERMTESLRKSPQGTMTARADMTGLIALKERYAEQGHKVTFTDLFVKIIGLALESNPIVNSSIEDGKLYVYQSVNIGVGVGTENGLFVPVIRNAEKKSVLEISGELKELSRKIKENRISADDMAGGTFTISNMGMFDVDIVTPIINPPEAAIMAIGATRREAVAEEDGTIGIRPLTTLSLTADHAVMDGLPAVRFIAAIKEIMKNPGPYLET